MCGYDHNKGWPLFPFTNSLWIYWPTFTKYILTLSRPGNLTSL